MTRRFALALSVFTCAASGHGGELERALLRLQQADRPYRVAVRVQEQAAPASAPLFDQVPASSDLHPSYQASVDLCERLDPFGPDQLPPRIARDYLESLADTGPILEALHAAGERDMSGMYQTWFGPGQAFEHTICGDVNRKGKLGGFHFWYLFHRYEQQQRARYLGIDYGGDQDLEGADDPGIVTGTMEVDFDGQGGRPPAAKAPRGGFTVGHSVMAVLAAGHLAARLSATSPEPPGWVDAALGPRAYPWRVRIHGGSLRTFWPRFVPPVQVP